MVETSRSSSQTPRQGCRNLTTANAGEMDDHHITVKLLDGRKLTEEWERGWTVRALKRKLAGERESLRYCKLYYNVRILRFETVLVIRSWLLRRWLA